MTDIDMDDLPYEVKREIRRLRRRVTELEGRLPFGGRNFRNLPKHKDRCSGQTYCGCPEPQLADPATAELVCSDVGQGMHKPVIDFDLPISVVESHTPGHFHLYIEKEVPHQKYHALLIALVDAGLVEEGYLTSFKQKHYTAVRHPDRLAKK